MTQASIQSNGVRLDPPVEGTVYGVILNLRQQLEAMADAFGQAPYGAEPNAPVLYIKPPNTYLPRGGVVAVPPGVEALEMGAAIAVVIGRTACRVSEAAAMEHVAGYAVAIDVCVPHASLHRPAVRQRCRDGFLPIGPVIPRDAVAGLNQLSVALRVNGRETSRYSTADLVRPIPRLIADVTEFMTLYAGDVLLAGLPPDGPLAKSGDAVEAEVSGLGVLACALAAEAA
jgi:5-oxopent-3-ene-1,2,5-tricarboxylate decarboxylase/2-hydroxyhepta-2,4-diene-1,7-dioate isomerase